MAIEITGGPRISNIEAYSVVEDATPMDPAAGDGGYGQLNWTSEDWTLARRMRRRDISLSDHERGLFTGTVREVGGNNHTAQLTADSELGKFNVRRTVKPFSGKISDLMQYYIGLAGIYTQLDYLAPDRTVHVPGFEGLLWDQIKYFLSANRLEMALVADKVVVRPLRMFQAVDDYLTQHDYQVNTQDSSITVEVKYYNNKKISKGEVYPVPYSDEEPSIQSVEANETVEFDVELSASLSKVYQPVASDEVGPGNRSGTSGVYTIVGNDNLPVKAAQWSDNGGKLEVILKPESDVITIKVTGADIKRLAPFRIAESAGGTDYNSLHITGDGVAWREQSVVLYTGADPLETSSEIGATVENPYITTKSQAYTVGQRTAAAFSSSQVSISGSATTINRSTMDRQQLVATLGDVDWVHGQEGIYTGPEFNDRYADELLQEFDEHWLAMFRETFQNQVYGNISGARVYADYAFFRIDSATITPDIISYEGTIDTTISDFNKVWVGKTIEDFNEVYDDETSDDFSTMPLWAGQE